MSDYRQRRKVWKDVSGSTVEAAANDLSGGNARVLVTGRTGYTIFVQKATFNVITDNAATNQLQDAAGLVIAKTKASPGIGPIPFDFGEEGRALGQGQSLQLSNSAAGLAADVTWEAYMRPTGTLTQAQV